MLSAFLTGFVGGVAKQIEEDDKTAREEMNARVQQRMKEKAIAQEKAEEIREELKQKATALRSIYSNATEAELIGVLNSGLADTYIKNGIDAQSRARTTAALKQTQAATGEAPLTLTSTAKRGQPLFIQEAGEEMPYKTVDEYIKARTTLAKPAGATMGAPADTTSFGLRLTGPEKEKRAALARAGMTEEELLATRLPEGKEVAGRLNLDILKEEEKDTFAKRKDKAALALLDAVTPEDKKSAQAEWAKIIDIESRGEAPSESSVRSNFKSLIDGVARTSLSDKQYTTDSFGNFKSVVSQEGKTIFMRELRKGAQPLLNTYTRIYGDDQGRLPESMVPALVASGIIVDKENRIKGFSPSMFGLGGFGPSDETPAAASASKVDAAQDRLANAPPSKAPAVPKVATAGVVVQTEQGPISFPTQAQADAFKKAAGLE